MNNEDVTAHTTSHESGDDAPSRPKVNLKKLMLSVGSALAAAALLVAAGSWYSEYSERRTVPDVVAMSVSDANNALADAELEVNVDDGGSQLDERLLETKQQKPKAGTVLHRGDTVNIVLAPKEVEVPKFEGRNFPAAESLASEGAFELASDYRSNQIPDGWQITGQSVAAGTKLAAGSEIKLTYEVPVILMPDLVGMTDIAPLPDNTLVWNKVGEGNRIVSADVATGTKVEPFAVVTLQMGYEMPDFLGKTASEAEKMFPNVTTNDPTKRIVYGQSIPPGTLVASNAELALTVGPPTTVIRITGNGSRASVTWISPGSYDVQQASDAPLPWEQTFEIGSGYTSVLAQADDGDSISCQIIRNGKEVSNKTSTGRYSIVECSRST